jgi:hypothetical protein
MAQLTFIFIAYPLVNVCIAVEKSPCFLRNINEHKGPVGVFFDQRTEVSPLMAGKKTVIALSSYGHGMK